MSTPSPLTRLFDYISEYESDTFSAKGSEMTSGEALTIANELMGIAVTDMMEKKIDGGLLGAYLEGIREAKK